MKDLVLAHTHTNSQVWAKMVTIAALFRASVMPMERGLSKVSIDRLITKTKANMQQNFSSLFSPQLICFDHSNIDQAYEDNYDEPMLLQLKMHVQFTMTIVISTFYFYIREADGYPFVDVRSYCPISDNLYGEYLAIEEVA